MWEPPASLSPSMEKVDAQDNYLPSSLFVARTFSNTQARGNSSAFSHFFHANSGCPKDKTVLTSRHCLWFTANLCKLGKTLQTSVNKDLGGANNNKVNAFRTD